MVKHIDFDERNGAPDQPISTVKVNGKQQRVSPVFKTYWKFAAERHAVFTRRLDGALPSTNDPIIQHFKFTNAFRVLDRTSQYLVRDVIQQGDQSTEELFFRILIFKLFNKIDTWELLLRHLGEIRLKTFRFELFDKVLTDALARGQRIYSAAYIMPSGGPNGESRKHRSHLRLLEQMLSAGVPSKLSHLKTMKEGFTLLRSFPMIGDFLAYQYITDVNYSSITNFTEMEFVVAGPGALDGLKKCFPDMVVGDASSIIHFVCEEQDRFQAHYGVEPVRVCGRPLQLIDCQNLFCETDKYARIAHPDIRGYSGRTRIKQAYRTKGSLSKPVFPDKWQVKV
jgi:hypothetical protein